MASHPATGLRRIDWVRIELTDCGARCQLVGVGHRLPARRPTTLDTAVALQRAGVPTVVVGGGAP